MIITVAMLREKDACRDQVRIFEGLFGASAKPTLANCRKAVKVGLSLDWAASRLLPAPAWEAYDEAITPAWEAYDEAITPAQKVYEKAIAPARKAYDEACARAFYNAAKGV